MSRTHQIIKRVIDIIGTSFFLVVLSPVMLLAAIFIVLESTGPVVFYNPRCGKDGREFRMYKFRSMIHNAADMRSQLTNEAEGSVFKVESDPRITRVGRVLRRTSIDELPQLVNVLIGDMSLVGPRPLALEEMSADKTWMETRLKVDQGVTGLWQVKGRVTKKFADWVKYDTEYVNNQSLTLDLKILFLTVWAVLSGRGAY